MPRVLKKQTTVLGNCRIADTFWARFRGLMGQKSVAPDTAVVFPRCNSIHTFFMCMPIDVIFVDKQGSVVKVLPALPPWKMLLPIPKAAHAIEMDAGQVARLGIAAGDRLSLEGVF